MSKLYSSIKEYEGFIHETLMASVKELCRNDPSVKTGDLIDIYRGDKVVENYGLDWCTVDNVEDINLQILYLNRANLEIKIKVVS